jgi:hypothetical protein
MIDPQDLLYTNNFFDTNIINDKEIEKETKNYDRFVNYESSQNTEDTNNTLRFLNNTDEESDNINIKKSYYQPFPVNNKKNHYPLLDPLLKDISKDRYTKIEETNFSIDTGYRDLKSYPLTSNFQVNLSKNMTNVQQIKIDNINIPNFLKSVEPMNNNLTWQYLSNYYENTDLSFNIIPFPNPKKIYSYFSLPYSVYNIPSSLFEEQPNFNPSAFLISYVNINPGNYSLNELLRKISLESGSILHGNNIYYPDNKYKITEEPYYSFPSLRGTNNIWVSEFNNIDEGIFMTNKMENVQLISLQFFKPPLEGNNYSTDYYKQNDIYYGFSSLGSDYTLDPKYFYFTVPFIQNITDLWFNNNDNKDNKDFYPNNDYNNPFIPSAFPLIINTNSGDIILNDSVIKNFTMTPFFNLDVYTTNSLFRNNEGYTEDELLNVNYYKFNDLININKNGLNIKLVRFAFRYNNSNSKGIPFSNSFPAIKTHYVVSNITQTLLFNDILINYFKFSTNVPYVVSNNRLFVGRSLLTRFIYGKENGELVNYKIDNIYETKTSILEYFSFSIANGTNGFLINVFNNGFSFVHSNLYNLSLNFTSPIQEILSLSTKSSLKTVNINYNFIDNNYFIKNNNFVYLKIKFIGVNILSNEQNQLNISYNDSEFHINQNYSIDEITKELNIGDTVKCYSDRLTILKKSYDGIFCKILVSPLSGNTSNITNEISSKIIFNGYDFLLNDITTLEITLLDSKLRVVKTIADYNFDLIFIHSVDKLKETNINTKTNKVDLVGENY